VSGIFLNYRYSSERVLTVGAMHNFLARHFGADQVFMDRQMRTGTRYPTEILGRLAQADVLVAVIHDGWLAECRGEGDWVYREIKEAIEQGKHLVQVVLPDARRLKDKELKQSFPDIRELAKRQAHKLEQFDRDMAILARDVEKHIAPTWAPPHIPAPRDPSRITRRVAATLSIAVLVPLLLAAARRLTTEQAGLSVAAVLLFSVGILAYLLIGGVVTTIARHPVYRWETKPLFTQPFWRRLETPLVLVPAFMLATGVWLASRWPWPAFVGGTLVLFYAVLRSWSRLRDEEIAAEDGWPVATTAMELRPGALHADVGRLRVRLERRWSRPLARNQRDQALWVLARLDEAVDRLTGATRRSRSAWLVHSTVLRPIGQMYALAGAAGASALVALWALALAQGTIGLRLAVITASCMTIGLGGAELWYRIERRRAELLATEVGAAVAELRELVTEPPPDAATSQVQSPRSG
jgi:hypothetical protein